jgi:anti-anti-sigma regulatory factor
LLAPLLQMTLKIERATDNGRTFIRLVGRVDAEHLEELKFQVSADAATTAIDLEEVSLVDVEAVRFLVSAEKQGLEILNPSAYIREWMNRVRGNKS